MKKQSLTFAIVLSLLLAAGSAFAQTINVAADIPFGFVVNKHTVPAGHYTLKSLGPNRMLMLRDSNDQPVAIISANRAESLTPSANTKLIFRRYENRYFLSQVWMQGEDSGLQLPKSARESEVALDFHPERVEVLAQLSK
ncbi:MAG TPA: hypothetical protein VFA89_09590 [Terriglobales bacterium]|jgi:hypothetical protein|nr:hypothetical protein [Terriglobales bacterium]